LLKKPQLLPNLFGTISNPAQSQEERSTRQMFTRKIFELFNSIAEGAHIFPGKQLQGFLPSVES
jgi:hypothetical protein